jgi:hypothetical protein
MQKLLQLKRLSNDRQLENSSGKQLHHTRFRFTQRWRMALVFLITLLPFAAVQAQSSANYTFGTATNGSLTTTANGDLFDMSSGTTQLVAASQDDNPGIGNVSFSTLAPGFEFYLMGRPYTQFSANSNGIVALSNTNTNVSGTTYGLTTGSQTMPLISAFCADLKTGTSGKVHYKFTGTGTNRVLVIEFLKMAIIAGGTPVDNGTYQVRLYEGSNMIEFVYGTMNRNSANPATAAYKNVSIGFATGTTTNNLAAITSGTATIPPAVSTTSPFTTQLYALSSAIPNLDSPADGSRRVFTFTPAPAPNAPSGLFTSSPAKTTMNLNWLDNSNDEAGFAVFRSTDGSNFTYVTTTAANTQTYTATGLSLGTLYYWKVAAVKETGAYSNIATGTTAEGDTYTWAGPAAGGAWGISTNWSPTRTTVLASDILKFDGADVTTYPGGTISVTGVLTASIGKLILANGANVTLAGSNTTLTMSGGIGNDLDIPAGCALTQSSVNLAFSAGGTVAINGTLTNPNTFTANNAAVTIGSGGVLNNSGTIASTSATSLSISGTLTNSGSGIFQNLLTTVNSGGVINNSSSTVISGSVTSLKFLDGSTYNHNFTNTPGTIPTATWSANSTVVISTYTTNTTVPTNIINQTFGNIIWNVPTTSSEINLGLSASTITAAGTFSLLSHGGTKLSLPIGGVLSVNNFTQATGTILNLIGGSSTLKVSGTFTQSGTASITKSGTGSGTIEFNGTSPQNVTIGAPGIDNAIDIKVSNNAGINLTGTLPVTNATLTIASTATDPISGSGTVTYSGSTALFYTSATGSITATATVFPALNGPTDLKVDITAASPNNTFALPGSRTVGNLNLANGLILLYNNDLTVGTITSVTFSNSRMVVTNDAGQLRKIFASTASPAFTFPIGTLNGSTAEYSPATLTFSANSDARTIGAKVKAGAHPQNGGQTDYLNRYWSFTDNQEGIGTYTYTGTFGYPASDVSGIVANIKANRYNSATGWSEVAGAAATTTTSMTTATGLTEVTGKLGSSDFTGRVNPPVTYVWNGSVSNNFTVGDNWTPGRYFPRTGDFLTFDNGATITATNVPAQTIAQLSVTGNTNVSFVPVANAILTTSGALTVDANSTLDLAGLQIAGTASATVNGTLKTSKPEGLSGTLTSALANTGGITLGNASTIEYNGTAAQTISSRSDYNNLIISNPTTATLNGNAGVAGALTTNSGIFDMAAFQITGTGSVTVNGTLKTSKAGGLSGTPTSALANTLTGITLGNASTIEYNGTAAQTITARPDYNNLIISNPVTATLNGNAGVAGALTTNNGIFDMAAFQITGTGSVTVNGTLKTSKAGGLSGTPTSALASTLTGITLGNASTIEYNGTAAQTITARPDYNNLTSSGTGARTLVSGGTIGIAGIFTPGTNAYTTTGSTVDFNGSGPQTIPALNYNNMTSSGAGNRTLASSGTIGIAGVFTAGTNLYDVTGSTVSFNGGTTNITVPVLNVSSGPNYFNLTMSNTATANNFAGDMTIGGNYSQTSGTVKANGLAAGGTRVINVNGNFNLSGGAIFQLIAASAALNTTVIVKGNVDISGISSLDMEKTASSGIAILDVDGNFTTSSTAVTVIDFGAALVAGNEIRIAGNLIKTGGKYTTTSPSSSSLSNGFLFDGVNQNFSPGGTASTYVKYTVKAGSTVTLLTGLALNPSGANISKLIVNGALDMAAFQITNTGSVTVNGTLKTSKLEGLNGTTSALANTGGITLGNASTVEYNGTAAQTITPRDYNNLIISGNRGANTITLGSGTIGITGAFTPVATFSGLGGYNTTSNTVNFKGTTPQTTSAFASFNNLTISNPTTVILSGNAGVAETLNMISGILETTNTFKVNLGNSATITEKDDSYVKGVVESKSDMSTAGNYTFNGIGLTLSPQTGSVNFPGSTIVRRKTAMPATGANSSVSITRVFEIVPEFNQDLNVTMVFSYQDHELNGIIEDNLVVFKSVTGSAPWAPKGVSSRNAGSNFVTLNGITDFSTWTLGDISKPLPVELVSFTAVKNGNNAILNWSTATEKDSRGFEVQVSEDAREFRTLGFVESRNGNTTQQYSFTDTEKGKSGVRYYRLKQIDQDGTASFSGPKAVRFENLKLQVSTYPNPFSNELNLNIQATQAETATITITDLAGKTVFMKQVKVEKGGNVITVGLDASHAAGIYLLTTDVAGERISTKLIKQ